MDAFEPYLSFALALFSGLLVGLEREHSRVQGGTARHFIGGVRTFPLFALLAATTSALSASLGPWPFVVAGAATLLLTVMGHRAADSTEGIGLATEGAFLFSFMLGALSGTTHVFAHATQKVFVVSSLSVVATLLLSAKPFLHDFSTKISRDDVIATVKFLMVAVVILPLLPDEPLGPYGVLNPWKLGLNVSLIAGVSFIGYAASRVLGPGRGLLVSGLVGGLVSSTAVTLAAAHRSRQDPSLADASALSAVAASVVMTVRVGLLVAAVNRAMLSELLVPLICMGLAGAAVATVFYARSRKAAGAGNEPKLHNPFELSSAMKFAAAIVAVMLISRWAQEQFGSGALYVASLLAGLADVDAISISTAGMARSGHISAAVATLAIFLAVLANTVAKTGIAWVLGARSLSLRLTAAAALSLLAGGAGIGLRALFRG